MPSILAEEAESAGVHLQDARRLVRTVAELPAPQRRFLEHLFEMPAHRRDLLISAMTSYLVDSEDRVNHPPCPRPPRRSPETRAPLERRRTAALVRTAFQLRSARLAYLEARPGSPEEIEAWNEVLGVAPLLETLLLGDGDKLPEIPR